MAVPLDIINVEWICGSVPYTEKVELYDYNTKNIAFTCSKNFSQSFSRTFTQAGGHRHDNLKYIGDGWIFSKIQEGYVRDIFNNISNAKILPQVTLSQVTSGLVFPYSIVTPPQSTSRSSGLVLPQSTSSSANTMHPTIVTSPTDSERITETKREMDNLAVRFTQFELKLENLIMKMNTLFDTE